MLAELEAALREEPAPTDRVLVLRSSSAVFCAGMDLRQLGAIRRSAEGNGIGTIFKLIESHRLPSVAIVNGDAIAGGNELALHCDFVVASENARFGMSHAQIGIVPAWNVMQKVIESSNPAVAREILLLGDPLPARRMLDLGLIARCVPPEKLEAAAGAIVERLARNAPLSLYAIRAALVRQMRFREDIPHADIDEIAQHARDSADATEGSAARLEKRPPRFTGR